MLLRGPLHGGRRQRLCWRFCIRLLVGGHSNWTFVNGVMADITFAGIVRAPFFTTVLQVASRVVLIWGIVENFPVEQNPAYSTMLLAWSATEVVRYSYFVFFLTGQVPPILAWLRYVNSG